MHSKYIVLDTPNGGWDCPPPRSLFVVLGVGAAILFVTQLHIVKHPPKSFNHEADWDWPKFCYQMQMEILDMEDWTMDEETLLWFVLLWFNHSS